MTQTKIADMENNLAQLLEKFLDDNYAGQENLLGNDTNYLMARAAVAVLLAVDEIQDYLLQGGYMKDEE
jgi:hypothetical protein